MASARCTVFSLLVPSSKSTRNPPLILVSSIPTSRPSKTTRRKNHLRPKILKSLNPKPHPPILPLLPQEPSPPPLSQPAPPTLCPPSPEEEDLCVEVPAGETRAEDIAAADSVEEADKLEDFQASEAIQAAGEDFTVAESAGEADKLEDFQVSETLQATVEGNGVSGKVSASAIFKFGGVCLVGAFVYQTICSVAFVANYSSRLKDGNLEINGKQKKGFLFNGNGKTAPVTGAGNLFSVMSQIVMEKKIEEIKLMANEARRIEGMKKEEEEDEGYDSDDDLSNVSSPKLGVEREIGARLMKLQSRINSNKDSSAALQISSLENSAKSAGGVARGSDKNVNRGNGALQISRLGNSAKSAGGVARDGNKNANKGNEALMFKKKLKFKSPSTKQTKTPKGFPGTRDSGASDAKKRNSSGRGKALYYASDATDQEQISHEDKNVNKQDAETQEGVSSFPLKERGEFGDDESKEILNNGKNLEAKMETPEAGVKTTNNNNGGVQGTSFGVSAVEVRHSRELRTQNSQSLVEENQDSGPIFEKDVVHSINGSSRHGLARNKSAANRLKDKQANTRNDMWWLNLRYVLVILMQRGSNGGAKGLYSLKFTSEEEDRSYDSYTVAFEDHTDANNFCFLLESFFSDLGDFTADAVPMSIQELKEEITSRAKKVVVVKKRQLQLYAGQPLADVENALRSLVEQDQSVP